MMVCQLEFSFGMVYFKDKQLLISLSIVALQTGRKGLELICHIASLRNSNGQFFCGTIETDHLPG